MRNTLVTNYLPDKDEFLRRSARGNLVPVYREILADMETPVSAFRKVGLGRNSFLLESVEGGERLARYSFIGSDPFCLIRTKRQSVTILEDGKQNQYELP